MGIIVRTALLASLLAGSGPACAGLADLQVYDRTAQRYLTIHEFHGQRYVAGQPGHEYELKLRNDGSARLLAVASVDGVNVVTGETADPGQSGYVLAPYQSVDIAGWRKSLDDIAAFYFTRHHNSYAARTGRPFDVGVIGVALFREKSRCCDDGYGLKDEDDRRNRADSAAEAPRAEAQGKAEEKLGTGHGRREHDAASYTQFERASDTPDEILAIYYDSRENLIAQGVMPREREYAQRSPWSPRPFPGGFTPDP